MGESIGLKAFYAAIIGGFNQTRGALLGGVLVGVLENLTGAYISPAYKEGVALMLFLVVIIFSPKVFWARPRSEKYGARHNESRWWSDWCSTPSCRNSSRAAACI